MTETQAEAPKAKASKTTSKPAAKEPEIGAKTEDGKTYHGGGIFSIDY